MSTIPLFGILWGAAASTRVNSGWTVQGCRILSQNNALASSDANTTIDNLLLEGLSEAAGKGLNFAGQVQNSSINSTTTLNFGLAPTNCFITGNPSNWTFGATPTTGSLNSQYASIPSGFGTPTGAAVLANFPGATATLAQCSAAIAEIYTIMKSRNWIST